MAAKAQTRRYDISVLRVISMFLIILCHIVKNYTFIPFSDKLSEVFNAGVYTFLGISGYLFGMRHIERFGSWILARVKRIWVPVFLVVILDIIFLKALSNETISARQGVTYALNLQGLMFLDWRLFTRPLGGEITNLVPLWFMTVIMLCYFIVPLLQLIREKTDHSHSCYRVASLVGLYLLFGIVEYYTGFHGFYFAAFATGYFFSAYHAEGKTLGGKKVAFICFVVTMMQFGRLMLQRSIDGTTAYHTYIGYSHSALGLLLLVIATELHQKNQQLFACGNSRIVQVLDGYSIYVYLVHQLFCSAPWNLFDRFPILVATAMFLACTSISAVVLKQLTVYSLKAIERIASTHQHA